MAAPFAIAFLGKVTDKTLTTVGARFTSWHDGFVRQGTAS
jgi:hypothetical protein